MDELKAIQASQTGDKTAFSELIEQYYRNIYRYAYHCAGNHQDADDICQETFLKAFGNIKALKDVEKFKGWIFRIASNLSRKRIKKMKCEKNVISFTSVDSLPQGYEGKDLQPYESLFSEEKKRMILKELQKMPVQVRMATILVLIEGQTQKETAEILNCSESTISRDLNTAKNVLRIKLQKFVSE